MADKHKQAGVFIRMPQELIDQLAAEAELRMVSKTWLASRLVIEGLRNLKPVEAPWLTETPPKPPVYRGIPICSQHTEGIHQFSATTGICVRCGMMET